MPGPLSGASNSGKSSNGVKKQVGSPVWQIGPSGNHLEQDDVAIAVDRRRPDPHVVAGDLALVPHVGTTAGVEPDLTAFESALQRAGG